MRPIYLKMTAFGSYCGAAEVDFTKLYDSGIFLITGRTGGGKTTILDAMCAALYGKATGSERAKEWRQLRCANAPASVDTELEFIFTVGGRKYRFYRRWHVPKSKNGETKINDMDNSCEIWDEQSDKWEIVASGKAKSVNDAAEDILKLTQPQFVKVIMLPQGEFRELLTATSDEKADIFKKLFETERWERMADKLTERYRAIEKQCEEHTRRKSVALDSVECRTAAELQTRREQTENQLKALGQQSALHAKTTEAAETALKAAEDTAALFEELAGQRASLEALNAQAAQYADRETRLAQSRRLRGVLPEYNLMKSAAAAAEKAEAALDQAERAAASAEEGLAQAQKEAENTAAWGDVKNALLASLAGLEELAGCRAEHDAALQKLREGESALQAEEQKLTDLTAFKVKTQERVQKGSEYLESCYNAASALNAATQTCHTWEQLFTLTREYEEKSERLACLAEQIDASSALIKDGEKELESLRTIERTVEQAIREDKAYSLAADLREGQPCPVCGAVHHPSPAQPSEATPTAEELERCRRNADEHAKKLETSRTEQSAQRAAYDTLEKDIRQLIEKAGSEFAKPLAEIASELESARAEAQRLQALADQTEKARRLLGQLNDALTANARDMENANTHINNLKIQIASDRQTVQSLTERLHTQGIGDFADLDRKISETRNRLVRTEGEIKALTERLTNAMTEQSRAQATLSAAKETMQTSQADRRAAEAGFSAKCGEIGIAATTDIAAGILPDATETDYDTRIAEYRQRCSFAQTRIAQLTEKIGGAVLPDLVRLRADHAAAVDEGHRISKEIGNVTSRLQILSDVAAAVEREEKALNQLSVQYRTAKRLNDYFSGSNDMRTSIHEYVISIKMAEVINSANLYMNRLSKGQYALQRKDSVTGRTKRQGLDIEIFDSSSGYTRAVSTLSGGELFLASLSLAFGLSDVVQSFAGGIHLDSLFIDEGFGSLDSETLDTAMDAITQVRENKLLGIISHVSELKERIPCGIEVIKTRDGSSLKIRT